MKILVRLPTWLGDTIMATPLLESLKASYKDATFTLIGSPSSTALIKRNFPSSRIIVDNSKQAPLRILSLYHLARQIGKQDIAITLQNNFLSALLLFMTRSDIRIGYAKECRSPLLTHALKPLPQAHQVQRYLHLLTPLSPSQTIDQLFIAHAPKPPYFPHLRQIGINTGGAFGAAKRWKEEYFTQTIQTLLQEGYGVILFGGQEDQEANARISDAFKGHEHFCDLTAKTSLEELIDTIATLQVFITNDSGPMHIAAALNIPIVAIFGSTDSKETSPWHAKARILSKNLPCSPCKQRICPLKHHACMQELGAQEVLDATRAYLAELS